MRFGVYLSTTGDFANPRLVGELAQEAEGAGWDGVFIPDHIHFGKQPRADASVTLAAIAVNTERVKFGPMVTAPPRRHP